MVFCQVSWHCRIMLVYKTDDRGGVSLSCCWWFLFLVLFSLLTFSTNVTYRPILVGDRHERTFAIQTFFHVWLSKDHLSLPTLMIILGCVVFDGYILCALYYYMMYISICNMAFFYSFDDVVHCFVLWYTVNIRTIQYITWKLN